MKNQIESWQKCFLLKAYEWHKKASCADLIKKKPDAGLLNTKSLNPKHKIINL